MSATDTLLHQQYDELYRALGRVVWEWAQLEEAVSLLIFDLCAVSSKSFYEDDGVQEAYAAISSNLDLWANINAAKALALLLCEDLPALFGQLEPLLNTIDGPLRNERNRFVHDRWVIWGSKIVRVKSGSKITRKPGTGDISLHLSTAKEFTDIAEIEAVADQIAKTAVELETIRDFAQETYRQKYTGGE